MAPLTLQILVEKFLVAHPEKPASMYHTTANHITRMLGLESPADVLLTHSAKELPTQLERYLRMQAPSSPSKVRNNKTQAKTLVRWGIENGLIPPTSYLSPAWQTMWAQKKPIYRTFKIGKAFAEYCSEHRIAPSQVTAAHFHAWRQDYFQRATQEKPPGTVRTYITQTRAILIANADHFPRLVVEQLARAHPVRIALSHWPVPLQRQWQELEVWLTRPHVLGRQGRSWKPRVVRMLQSRLEELYGYLTDSGKTIHTLQEMAVRESLEAFLQYKFEIKNNVARSILSYCVYFRKVLDFLQLPSSWLHEEFLAAIPAEDLRLRPIPRHTIPSYELLQELPLHVEREIASLEKELAAGAVENREGKRVRLARLWRYKLVFLFLLHLSWRMSNLTQLRRGTLQDLPLYRTTKCQFDHGLLYQERSGQWRFFFPSSATKNGRVVQGELPASIVPTLECYLKDHWPQLRARDRSFLFPNSEGRLSGTSEWCNVIKRVTFRYLRVEVNPHKFRHAFAFYYLTQWPENYLTLSRYLWHHSVEVTIRIYGGFEPEDALRQVEAWRAGRGEQQTASHSMMRPLPANERAGGFSRSGFLSSLRKRRV